MAFLSKNLIKKLLLNYSTRPIKRLGQHFLTDKNVLQKIIQAANLRPEDIILEIGPGIGTLTIELAKRVKKVVAVEKDFKMLAVLKEVLKDYKNVKIVQGDILKVNLKKFNLRPNGYKIVANIPYYLTSRLIRNFLETKNPPKEMVLMIQKEVAQRIIAGSPKTNLLAVSVRFYAKPEIIYFVSKKSFWPQPKIDSAIIKITVSKKQSKINKNLFFKIVRAGFLQPRKQILNNLSKGLALSMPKGLKLDKERIKSWLRQNKISPTQRAETLTVNDWLNLVKTFLKI
jgi:16S rRNA (adenine1518-N6/adenine1519-N6)-dimethyltransferase